MPEGFRRCPRRTRKLHEAAIGFCFLGTDRSDRHVLRSRPSSRGQTERRDNCVSRAFARGVISNGVEHLRARVRFTRSVRGDYFDWNQAQSQQSDPFLIEFHPRNIQKLELLEIRRHNCGGEMERRRNGRLLKRCRRRWILSAFSSLLWLDG